MDKRLTIVFVLFSLVIGFCQSHAQLITVNTGIGRGDATWEYSVDQLSWFPAVEVPTTHFEDNGGFSWARDSYSPSSRWISVSTNLDDMIALNGKTYWYRASFVALDALPIVGRILVDDVVGDVRLNGVDQLITGVQNWAGPWLNFQTGSTVVGANRLTMAVNNDANLWTGIRVEGTVVPEPSTYALLLLSGAASLWALKRRKG